MDKFDIIVIGAGVVGLAIAEKLSQQFTHVLLIDKNDSFGEETSSRNSEVIHAGIYYPQNSLKAKLCVKGKKMLYHYCQEKSISHKNIGKLLVAHNDEEEAFLEKTLTIAANNGVNDLTWQTTNQLKKAEPALSATAALLSPSTGIIDVHNYMQSLLNDFEQNGGLFVAKTQVTKVVPENNGFNVNLTSVDDSAKISANYVINSAGLHSTAVAALIDNLPTSLIPQLHWCKGHYFSYSGKSPFKQLIYPIPEANGLGIHASLDVGGQLKFGPDTQYVNQLSYVVPEQLKEKFYQAIKKYFPAVEREKMQPAYAGIRPKLQGEKDGFKDFVIQTKEQHGVNGLINLYGIDSPGLTSSLAIADYVAKAINEH